MFNVKGKMMSGLMKNVQEAKEKMWIRVIPKLKEEVGLTDEQIAKIKKILEEA